MQVLKLAFLSLIAFFLLITAMSLLIPSQIRISKAVNITGNTDSVFYLINNQDQWRHWHPAFQLQHIDSLLRKNKISLTPVVKTDSLVVINWQQGGKAPVLNSWQVHHFAPSPTVTLQWYMDFRLRWYPWEKFSSLFYEKTYGVMMEQGLSQIKTIVEKAKVPGETGL